MPSSRKSSSNPRPSEPTPAGGPERALKLGDLLVQSGAMTEAQRDQVLSVQRREGGAFGAIAEKLFSVSPSAVEHAWAAQVGQLVPRVDPRRGPIDPAALSMISRRQAWQFRVMPLRLNDEGLVVCTTLESLPRALKFTGWRIDSTCQFVLADADKLGEAMEKYYPMAGMTRAHLLSA